MQIKYENANTCVFLKNLSGKWKTERPQGTVLQFFLYSYHPADVSVTQYSIL